MHYLALLRGTQPATPPPPELLEAIGALGLEAKESGALLDTGGMPPGTPGAHVVMAAGTPTTTNYPSPAAADLIGYALYEVETKQEAIAWTNRFLHLQHTLWPGWRGETDLIEVFRQT